MWKLLMLSALAVGGVAGSGSPVNANAENCGPVLSDGPRTDRLVEVKFREELEVRLRERRLCSMRGGNLAAVYAALERHHAVQVRPLISLPLDSIEALRREAEAHCGCHVPDMASWYHAAFPDGADVDLIARELGALGEVEYAYPAPEPVPPPALP